MGLIVENITRPCASAGTTGNLALFVIHEKSVDNNKNVVLVSSFVLLHHSSFDKDLENVFRKSEAVLDAVL